MDRLAHFYANTIGLKVAHQEPGTFAFFEIGPARLAIYPGRTRDQAAEMFMVLDVPDIQASAAKLVAQDAGPTPIKAVPFGRAFKVTDPEGNQVEFHQPD